MDDPRGDDFRAPVEASARLGRSYRGLIPVVLVVVVVGLGWFGRQGSAPPRDSGPSDGLAAETAEPSRPPHVALLEGPPALSVDPFSSSIAADGRRVFYSDNNQMLLSVGLTPGTAPMLIDWAGRCRTIDGVAVSGETLLYVETKRGDPVGSTCTRLPSVQWTIMAYDLSSHVVRPLATGTRPTNHFDPTAAPVHVAVSETQFAFERPVGSAGDAAASTIEIHSLADGSLAWTATVDGPVRNLMIGGTRLAAVTSSLNLPQLFVADETAPAPRLISAETTGGSLSADGRYLVWDSAGQSPGGHPSLMLLNIDTDQLRDLGPVAAPPGFPSVQPAVAATANGPVVAWYSSRPQQGVSVRFVDPAHPDGAWLETGTAPSWMSVQNDDLVWIAPPAEGGPLFAYATALRTTALATADVP